jgi:hypothetical protein
VDAGNAASNDQDLPAERFLHNHEFTKPNFDLFVCFLVAIRCFSDNSINCRINEFEAILGQHVLTNHLIKIQLMKLSKQRVSCTLGYLQS